MDTFLLIYKILPSITFEFRIYCGGRIYFKNYAYLLNWNNDFPKLLVKDAKKHLPAVHQLQNLEVVLGCWHQLK